MMAPEKLSGMASSECGVEMAGFYATTMDAPRRLSEITLHPTLIAQCEVQGNILFLACQNKIAFGYLDTRLATFRRDPSKFFVDLPLFLRSLKARAVLAMNLSESFGNMTLTLVYVPPPALDDSGEPGA